jgi:dTDP-4-amino-4,6-dideoxygalactose transaminase
VRRSDKSEDERSDPMFDVGKEEIEAIKKVIESKKLFRFLSSEGEVDRFEKEWAEKIGTSYSLSLTSGTAAMTAGLAAMGIGPGDEVIVPGYTFMATASAVLMVGAIPVIAEIDESLTLDIEDVRKKISPYTKAIMPVHMVGFPSNMDAIMALAKKHGIRVLEDACQADGGSYKGKRLGSIGDAGAFSFNAFKILCGGEGGALNTDSREIFERALIYHDGGCTFRQHAKDLSVPIFAGFQYRYNEISGAMMREQVKKLDNILSALRGIKKCFMEVLSGAKNIQFTKSYDREGDCGTTVGFTFETEEMARSFAGSIESWNWIPFDSGKHVYSNWTPILEKRGAFHPAMDPYKMPQNQGLNMEYAADMCPNTLDILKRTVLIPFGTDWAGETGIKYAENCKLVASKL